MGPNLVKSILGHGSSPSAAPSPPPEAPAGAPADSACFT
ncbi:Uncharacterised protein [Bordetella pertussis]|nr:Uncharacterised protein [Bordetella pertussis]